MSKDELLYILSYVFEHYLDCDISDEARENVEQGYNKIKDILLKTK